MRHWRLLAVLSVLALFTSLAIADERILDYHSDIQVRPDSSIEVHETIRVRSEGRSIRHGIFRDFPTTYTDKVGSRYRVGFTSSACVVMVSRSRTRRTA